MAFISQIKLPSGTTYPLKAPVIPYGTVDSTSTSTAFTATVNGITELADGTIMMLKNGYVTSESGFTLNINNLGAKPVYNNLTTGHGSTAPTRDTTIFNVNYTMLFIYSTSIVEDGAWICYRGYDSNSNTIGYQLRGNSSTRPATDKGYRYRLWLTSADDQGWVPINTSTATDASTARTLNTRAIDPFGEIVYNSYNGTTNASANVGATTTWQQYTLSIGYSYVKTLTAYDPVYLKCTPQTTGGAVMNDIVQKLPTTKDGYIYIYLGIAYSTTAMELRFYHPVYYHDGTGVRVWTGTIIPTKTSDLTNDGDGNSAFATMDDIGQLGGGTITAVKTTAGAHTTINVTSGNAEFNVPTKTSHLTNDSGYITGITSSDVTTALGYTPYNSTNPNGYTSNTGTVTNVEVSNATNGGLTISGSPITTSGTISIGHSNVLSAAQTTQAVYPIKIDKNGHISAYGSAVTIPSITLNGSSTTSPSFYAPTTAGTNGYVLKSNGSGAPTWISGELTDTKVTVATATDGTTYYPILATGTGTATRQIDPSGALEYMTSEVANAAVLSIGGTYDGYLQFKTSLGGEAIINYSGNANVNDYYLPDASGTIALTSDITTATLSAIDDGNGNVTLSVSGTTMANGVSF